MAPGPQHRLGRFAAGRDAGDHGAARERVGPAAGQVLAGRVRVRRRARHVGEGERVLRGGHGAHHRALVGIGVTVDERRPPTVLEPDPGGGEVRRRVVVPAAGLPAHPLDVDRPVGARRATAQDVGPERQERRRRAGPAPPGPDQLAVGHEVVVDQVPAAGHERDPVVPEGVDDVGRDLGVGVPPGGRPRPSSADAPAAPPRAGTAPCPRRRGRSAPTWPARLGIRSATRTTSVASSRSAASAANRSTVSQPRPSGRTHTTFIALPRGTVASTSWRPPGNRRASVAAETPRNTKPEHQKEKTRKCRREYPNCAINSSISDTGFRSAGAGSAAAAPAHGGAAHVGASARRVRSTRRTRRTRGPPTPERRGAALRVARCRHSRCCGCCAPRRATSTSR